MSPHNWAIVVEKSGALCFWCVNCGCLKLSINEGKPDETVEFRVPDGTNTASVEEPPVFRKG